MRNSFLLITYMEFALNRLEKHYCKNQNELSLIINHIIIQNDDEILKYYTHLFDKKLDSLLVVADVFSILYACLINLYSSSPLLNIKYKNRKPMAGTIFGDDLSILATMAIIIQSQSILTNFILENYKDKIVKLNDEVKIDNIFENISPSNDKDENTQNLQSIKNNLLMMFERYIHILS